MAAFSPDGNWFAVPARDNTVRLWNSRTKEQTILAAHKFFVKHLSFAPDGRTLATGSSVGNVVLWSVATHLVLASFKSRAGSDFVGFSPDGRFLAAGQRKGLLLWDGQPLHALTSALTQ